MSHATPHRLLYFFVAFVLLMFFGLIYAWSLFVDPLEAEFGWDRSATSVVFTLSIITFCAGMLVAGALEERTSPRTVMLITAACRLGRLCDPFSRSICAILFSSRWICYRPFISGRRRCPAVTVRLRPRAS